VVSSADASLRVATPDLSRAIELLREDRASAGLHALPPAAESTPETRLLRGVLLATSGDSASAEDECRVMLAGDPMNASALHLLALCREHAGDVAGAVEHDRAAVYLEPRFALAHLHLGMLARRRGEAAEATRELRLAGALLSEEDDARILYFGGGLRREALIDLCRALLRGPGGAT
jgi:chemotaxis protein methyltransferase CheR